MTRTTKDLKTFAVSYTETIYYEKTFIRAKNREEAKKKFLDKFQRGKVYAEETDMVDMLVDEIKEENNEDIKRA